MMATIQEAARNAMAFAQELLGTERAKSLRLEEVASADENGTQVWRITLSMSDSDPVNAFAMFSQKREYKTFTVVKNTGEVASMKIREIAAA